MSNIKILLTADSYALPRLHPTEARAELSYEQAYPEQLRQLFIRMNIDVLMINNARHANVTTSLVQGGLEEILMLEPDYVIIQLGSADLWPASARSITPLFAGLQGRDPWVDIHCFKQNIEKYIAFCQKFDFIKKIIILNIPKFSRTQYERYPEALERTLQYNAYLQSLMLKAKVKLVNLYGLVDEVGETGIAQDGIHPTVQTSCLVAELIFAAICK